MKLTTYFRAMEMADLERYEYSKRRDGEFEVYKTLRDRARKFRDGLIRRMERVELANKTLKGTLDLHRKWLEEAEAKE